MRVVVPLFEDPTDEMVNYRGDSWRARVTHVCELQFNMSFLGMKIDFGGLDKWDLAERERNLREAPFTLE